jgi:hemerythrin-like domain-containing protein
MKTLSPVTIRRAVLDQHRSMARLLDSIDALLAQPRSEERLVILRREAFVLCGMLRMHHDYEESTLAPVLETIDAWGKERAEQLLREHREQRETAFDLEHVCEHGSDPTFVAALRDFLAQLRADISDEERHVLTKRIFSDLPIVQDAFGG